ncbi:MAG: hypothetical protein R2710_04855 [Acidimicrobiales bacterium]
MLRAPRTASPPRSSSSSDEAARSGPGREVPRASWRCPHQVHHRPPGRTHGGRFDLGIGDADYVVTSAKPYQQQWLVHLDGVDRREQADLLRSKLVVADPLDDADALFVHELIGRKVVDQHGTDHGEVVSVVANPASDLLELADGRLVPMVFVLSTSDGLISVEVPAGLLDGDD